MPGWTFDRSGGAAARDTLVDAGRLAGVSMSALLEYLQGRGVTFQVIPHAPAGATVEDALAVGLDPEEVVRTEVVLTLDGYALMVVPAGRTLDLDRARAAVSDPAARPARPEELATVFPDYEAGSVPPLGLFLMAPMYVDPEVVTRDSVTFAGGRSTVSIRMATSDLFRDDPVVVAPLTATTTPAPG